MMVVNASGWQQIDELDTIYYGVGERVPPGQSCSKVYHPFAWLRVHKHHHTILAARDHFGQETFYYAEESGRFIFGSTLHDVLKHLSTKPRWTKHLIRDCFMRIPADDPTDDPPYQSETYYEGVFRVTPGHYLQVLASSKHETPFWQLDVHAPDIFYQDERDYLAHFEWLLQEAIEVTTSKANDLAAEFSGGMDSTVVFVACRQAQLIPKLFTHVPPPYRKTTMEDRNVQAILHQYQWSNHHVSVDATDFEPLEVFKYAAMVCAGAPPNLNSVLSYNLYQAILDENHQYVLSGFGGDDGVSLIFPSSFASNIRDYQYRVLQGDLCHEMRMRLEYAALMSRSMGLRYIYPLLYPPLVEYCFLLPDVQKYKQGLMRCSMRDYLLKHRVGMNFDTKAGAVVPSTMQKCRDYFAKGCFKNVFTDLPLQAYIDKAFSMDDQLILSIYAFMLKFYENNALISTLAIFT